MTTWLAVLAVGGGSYLLRSLPLLVRRAAEPSAPVQRAIGHAGLAAITALLAASLRHHADVGGPGPGGGALVAVGVAGAITARRRPFALAIAAGLATYVLIVPILGRG